MKSTLQQLSSKQLAPVYLISGDEILLVEEACQTVRSLAQNQGFSERQVLHVTTSNFDWDSFLSITQNLSLFSDKTLIELYVESKITDNGAKILEHYAKNPAKDKILIVITAKADAAMQKSLWFKALDSAGLSITIWPVSIDELPSWITKRMLSSGLKTDNNGIKLLAEHAAGNLLAAAQEVEKLKLIYGTGFLTTEQIISSISDNARFDVFNLVDIAFAGDHSATIRVLKNLKDEKTEPTLVLWALARELRSLINIATLHAKGQSIDSALQQANVWSKRKPQVKKALTNYDLTKLHTMLQQVATIDLMVKGATQGDAWNELERMLVLKNKMENILC